MISHIKSFFLVYILFLASCSGKLYKDNYEKISIDMTISEVESILGKGESQASSSFDLGRFGGNISTEVIIWKSGTKLISITFLNRKVKAKAQNGL